MTVNEIARMEPENLHSDEKGKSGIYFSNAWSIVWKNFLDGLFLKPSNRLWIKSRLSDRFSPNSFSNQEVKN